MFVTELNMSRSATDAFEGSTGTIHWVMQLEGTETETDAHDYIWENAPETLTTRTGKVYNFQSIALTKDDAGNKILNVEITYTQTKPTQISFSTGGGSEKIEFSRKTRKCFIDDSGGFLPPVPNFQQAINVSKDAIEGVTIKTRASHFKVTKSFALSELPSTYLDDLEDLTATVNNATVIIPIAMGTTASANTSVDIGTGEKVFSVPADLGFAEDDRVFIYSEADPTKFMEGIVTSYEGVDLTVEVDRTGGSGSFNDWEILVGLFRLYPAGELLFDGVDGVFTPDERLEATMAFSVSQGIYPDVEDTWIQIGNIMIDDKKGWDYLWVHSQETVNANTVVRTPKAVFTEKVYESRDFSKLRITL